MDVLETLREEHQRLLSLVKEMEEIFAGLATPLSPAVQDGVRACLLRFINLFSSHSERETAQLFPVLQTRLPETDRWLIKMLEVQDNLRLKEARQLYELVSGAPSSVPVERLKESVAHVSRWVQEHVAIEENRLFPGLQAPP